MKKILLATSMLLLLFSCTIPALAQQGEYCDPYYIFDFIDTSEIKLPVMNLDIKRLENGGKPVVYYRGCVPKGESYIAEYRLLIISGNELLLQQDYRGKNPSFDETARRVIQSLHNGDRVSICAVKVNNMRIYRAMNPYNFTITGAEDIVTSAFTSKIITVEDTPLAKKLRPLNGEKMLLPSLLDMVRTGKLNAYAAGSAISYPELSDNQINDIFEPKPDTSDVEDIDGTILKKIVKSNFDYENIDHAKILYKKASGAGKKPEIEAIAPACSFFGDDGNFMCYKPLFWLKYEDIKDDIINYDKLHPAAQVVKNLGIR